MKRRATVLTLIALTLFSASCGSDDAPSASSDNQAAPPTTDAPKTTDAPPVTDAPPTLPTQPVDIDDGASASIEELAATAELVVIGTVTDETSLGRPRAEEDPAANEFVGLTVSVGEVLKGEAIAEVLLGWDAYLVDADGERVAVNVMNGIPVPQLGDQLLLFLRPVDERFADFLGGFPTHAAVGLDGIAFVEDGTVTITDSSSPDSTVLLGKTIDEVAVAI